MTLQSFSGSIGTIANASRTLVSDTAGILTGGTFLAKMRGASLGGVPFAIVEGRTSVGRRNAVHEYPFRDGVYVEDMGRQARRFEVLGYLVESTRAYPAAPIEVQRQNMLAVAERTGAVSFVHPTLGIVQDVNILAFAIHDRPDLGGCSEISMTLVENGKQSLPATVTVQPLFGDALDAAAIADYAARINTAIAGGAAVIQGAIAQAAAYGAVVNTVVMDVRNLWSAVATLPGEFGRFFGGANRGFAAGNVQTSTAPALLAAAVEKRAAVARAADDLQAADPRSAAAMGGGARALLDAAVASASDPADAIHIAAQAAAFEPLTTIGTSAMANYVQDGSSALAALFRRSAVAAMARTASRYQPSSLDDAVALRDRMTDVMDTEILRAGDSDDTRSYAELRELRRAVVENLDSRSEGLPALRNWTIPGTLPSLVLAQRLYRDAGRNDQLVKQIDPVHPAFCPPSFRALAG